MTVDRAVLEQDMLEYVEGDSWPEPESDGTPAPPPDPTAVSGILRRLNALQADRDLMDEVVEAEIRRLNEWRADRQAGIDQQIAYGKRAIEIFMRRFYDSTGKKSLALADGTPHLSAPRERLIVDDEATFIAWAKVHAPDMLREHPAELVPAKDEIKSRAARGNRTVDRSSVEPMYAYELTTDAGKIPGVHIEKATEDKFDVTLKEHV